MTIKRYPLTRDAWRDMPAVLTDTELTIGGWQVMQTWERPIMEVLAKAVTGCNGDVLEIGFGMGISASEVLRNGCRSYTVIEAHPDLAEVAREWAKQQNVQIRIIEGFWQDIVPDLQEKFDGILFDTFPLSHEERHRNHYPFIPLARGLLRAGGVLTYYSDENLDFRPEHLGLLLTNFEEIKLVKISGLRPPAECEYWHDSCMVIPVARKS